MNKRLFSLIIVAAVIAATFTSCNNAVDELQKTSAEVQKGAVITALSTRSDMSNFVAELKDTDFSDIEAEELTVFAVVNCNSTVETECEPVIVKRHIVAGKYARSVLSDSLQLTALDGTLLLVTVMQSDICVNGMKLGNEILVGKSVVYIVDGAIPATPQVPDNPNVSVLGLTINQSLLSLEVGKTEFIAMLIQPINATNQKVTWQLDVSGVVEVKAVNEIDSMFSITAVAAGTANITFTTADGGHKATCIVTVTEKTAQNGDDNNNLEGLYSGIFTVSYATIVEIKEADTLKSVNSVVRTITLELSNGKFICTDNTEGLPSANGAGTYLIKNDKISFFDEYFRTAELTWDWILGGDYDFTFNEKELKLSKGIYQYDLVKQ